MKKQRLIIIGGALAAAGLISTSAAVFANDGGDDDGKETAITGDALDKASAAALAYTGGGRVTETEADDEDSKYEVEVTMPDGSQVDVQLDENFKVVGSKTETGGDDD